MQTTRKFSLTQRMLMLMTAFMFIFTNMPAQIFINAESEDEVQNRALTVVLNADSETVKRGAEIDSSLDESGYFVKTGDTISFQIQSALNNAEGQKETNVHVRINSDCKLDFSNSFRDNVLVMGDGDNSVTLHLDELPLEDGKFVYDVWYTITPGQTVSGYIQFKTQPGVTANDSKIDVEVLTDQEVDGGSSLSIQPVNDSKMEITAFGKVDWESIEKTPNPENLEFIKNEDGSFSLGSDVTYDIIANPPAKSSGVIYADSMIVTDTLTLPQGLDFPDGVTAELVGDKIIIKSADKVVMEITDNSDLGFSAETLQEVSASVEGKNLNLSFKRISDKKDQQLAPLDLTATLKADGLVVNQGELEEIPENPEISNTASFKVAPVTNPDEYTEDITSEPADVPVDSPKPNLKITKTADKGTIKPGETVTYTITATNDGDMDWHGSIEDNLNISENVQITSVSPPPRW